MNRNQAVAASSSTPGYQAEHLLGVHAINWQLTQMLDVLTAENPNRNKKMLLSLFQRQVVAQERIAVALESISSRHDST